jgi:undecaprenyl pyrophosphate synthase
MQNEPREGLHVAIIMDGNGRWATRRGFAPRRRPSRRSFPQSGVWWNARWTWGSLA